METGTKAITVTAIGLEWELLLYDARWMLFLVLLCVVADFRFGWGESHKRYGEAAEAGDTVLMDKYKWHTSRAIRRTGNKLMDYVVWISAGLALGMALLEPLGVSHIYGGVVATSVIVCMCELPSACGHFFYLHGVHVESNTVKGFLKAFAVALARRKNKDVGDALDEGFKEAGKKE